LKTPEFNPEALFSGPAFRQEHNFMKIFDESQEKLHFKYTTPTAGNPVSVITQAVRPEPVEGRTASIMVSKPLAIEATRSPSRRGEAVPRPE
jgi:hypothetical protein